MRNLVIEGIATTPTVNNRRECRDVESCRWTLPVPLLLRHDHDKRIGRVVALEKGDGAIRFTAVIPAVDQHEPHLRDLVETTCKDIMSGRLRCVSVGPVRDPGYQRRKDSRGITMIKNWRIIEVSVTPRGVNPDAKIDTIRTHLTVRLSDHL